MINPTSGFNGYRKHTTLFKIRQNQTPGVVAELDTQTDLLLLLLVIQNYIFSYRWTEKYNCSFFLEAGNVSYCAAVIGS